MNRAESERYRQFHVERSWENERVTSQIEPIHWKITMLFYSAVHLVLAKMVESPLRYGETQEERARRTHDDIFGYIRDDKYLIKIYRPYNVLFRLSRRARYDVWKPGDHDMKNAEKAFGQVRDYFIKTFPNWFKRPRGKEA